MANLTRIAIVIVLASCVHDLTNGVHARVTKRNIRLPAAEYTLDYYVHVDTSAINFGYIDPPINTTKSANFGSTSLFAFNVTDGPDAATSQPVGFVRGFNVQAGYLAGDVKGVEVEVLTYDDGSFNGTVSLQGMVLNGDNEIAVVGGTGDFRGARGYGVVATFNGSHSVYHHTLHIDV